MRLYNTLSRKIEEFKPRKPKEVKLYTCGPTVYNYYHIGNLRNAVFNDTLRRTLALSGYDIQHVMNITDVGHLASDADDGEDKLEKGAAREGKTVWEVAEHYTKAFKADMADMNILPPSVNPHREKNSANDPYARATDFIPEQIDMVQALIDKGFAYQTKQAIYFDVTKLPSYGILSGQKLADKEVAARSEVVTDPEKHHPYDFAIWFFTVGHFADHTMRWPSPWGDGFPGWHLECSAIIHATLGDPIDIHTGGIDHIGTHHPNEMAQTEGAFGHPLAHYWVHNEFILVDDAKMSKSKNNSYTLKQVVEKGFHPYALRLLYLQSHYRSELNFSWDALEAAQNALFNIYAWADLRHQTTLNSMSTELDELFRDTRHNMLTAVQDDLNTSIALAALNKLMTYMSKIPIPGVEGKYTDGTLAFMSNLLGLSLADRPDITPEQKQLIADREIARQSKNWPKADELRVKLAGHNLEIDDTAAGPRWRRTSL